MSRTIRRKRGEPGWDCGRNPHEETGSLHEKYFSTDEVWVEYYRAETVGRQYYSSRPTVVTLTPKEVAYKLSRYHSDNGYGRTTGKCKGGENEASFRVHCNSEINRYLNVDGEHEIQLMTKKFLRGWWN